MITFPCFHCHTELKFESLPGRSESCPSCRYDVRVCRNCRHYDISCYNECREPMAERVVDKDRRNFCDYFSPGANSGGGVDQSRADALKKLDDLFKKEKSSA